jgi:transcriptional regulator of heat shock response
MDYRLAHVLRGVIEEYITTGRPVGSERLLEILGIDVSSATIRNVLRILEEEGYLEQPHTSAGRIPTDKGYRYYIDQLTFKDPSEQKVQTLKAKYKQYQHDYENPAQSVAKLLSDMTHSMAITGIFPSGEMHGSGISQMFHDEDEDSHEAIKEASMLLDNIHEYIHGLVQDNSGVAQVYIGQENPVFEFQHTSMIVRATRLPTGETALLLVAGPKRMQYRRNVGMLNAIASLLEHNDNNL